MLKKNKIIHFLFLIGGPLVAYSYIISLFSTMVNRTSNEWSMNSMFFLMLFSIDLLHQDKPFSCQFLGGFMHNFCFMCSLPALCWHHELYPSGLFQSRVRVDTPQHLFYEISLPIGTTASTSYFIQTAHLLIQEM